MANYRSWGAKDSIEQSKIMRYGNLVTVSKEYYLSLVEKGYISGFFDNYQTFELWLDANFDNYPDVDKNPM